MNDRSQTSGLFEVDEEHRLLTYHGFKFECFAQPTAGGLYKPVVRLVSGNVDAGSALLPEDTEEIAYATEAEAERHAQQQAVRWVNDRTGDPRGRL